MSAFKRTAPSDEAMRVAPIQGQLGPPPLQSRRQRQTTWDNSETIRCTDAPNNKAGFSKQKAHQCLKTGCESPTPFEKRKPCVHTHRLHRHESLKTLWPLAIKQECFSTAADLCVAHLKDSTCVVWTSWHCIMTVVPTPSAGTPVLGTLGPSWAPQTEATRQAAVVRLSSFPSTKQAAKRGENEGNDQLRSMIFIKFYHYEISWNIMKYHEISMKYPPIPQVLFVHSPPWGSWFLVVSGIQESRSPGRVERGTIYATPALRRDEPGSKDASNAAVVPKFLWSL